MTDAAVADDTELQKVAGNMPTEGTAPTDNNNAKPTGKAGLMGKSGAMWAQLAHKPLALAGIAAIIAIAVTMLLTTGGESDKALYFGLSERDAAEVVAELDKANIPYHLDKLGNIRVAESQLYDARLKVAAAGLPRGTGQGLEFLDEAPEIGRSQFAEQARYHHALERELAKSIASLGSIEKARVHLALPKKSVFIRDRAKPSASVVVHLYPGRVLDAGQVAAITHLVSSSIPELANDQITVVDQRGELISKPQGDTAMNQSFERMDYTRRLEQHYIDAIQALLGPMVGADQVRAQVVAEVDFSLQEETSELFDPNSRAVRSEQLSEEASGKSVGGVPGAVSNEPPPVTELTAQNPGVGDAEGTGVTGDKTRVRSVRNYEVSRTVRHERGQPGAIRRLSVAVVVGVQPVAAAVDAEGGDAETKAREYSPEQLDRLTDLVKSAVGFDEARGDSVRVINAEFAKTPEPDALSWWQEDAMMSLIKFIVAVAVGLFLLFTVVLPLLRGAIPGSDKQAHKGVLAGAAGTSGALGGPAQDDPAGFGGFHGLSSERNDQLLLAKSKGLSGLNALAAVFPGGLPDNGDYETFVAAAQYAAADDPVRAAQVLKRWIQDNV